MIATDPNQVEEFSLAAYLGEPAETRPTFRTRYLTARERLAADRLWAEAQAAEEEQCFPVLVAMCRLGIVGWKNIRKRGETAEAAFDLEQLPDLLTLRELWELPQAMLAAVRLSEEAKKNSASASASAGPAATDTPAAGSATPGSGT